MWNTRYRGCVFIRKEGWIHTCNNPSSLLKTSSLESRLVVVHLDMEYSDRLELLDDDQTLLTSCSIRTLRSTCIQPANPDNTSPGRSPKGACILK
jgi:hypothetical protein